MSKLLKWLDEHILEYLSLALLIFIPLYPKIPSFDILPGYIVRIRLDDFLVAFAFGIWLIWLYRKKVTLKNNPLFIPMAIYVVVGFLSTLSAMFITKTVPLQYVHVAKLFLNYGRRIEYFSVFLVFFSSIKSLGQIKKYVYVAAIVLFLVSIYGFGQRYLYWPAYSTMNREFSKGITLYLTPHARVLSTFGGHYDLAAYLMIVLTLFIPLVFVVKRLWVKFALAIISFAGFWLLILTVSRTSFIAYLLSLTVVFFALAFKKGWKWSFIHWFVVIFISLTIMLSFGDLSQRFAHVLKLDAIKNTLLSPIKKEAPSGKNVAFLDIGSNSDIPPTPAKPGESAAPRVPSDVYKNIPLYGSGSGTIAAIPRVYSQNAVEYDLSTGIRLDYTWPHAIAGFTKNPLLGSGYSTLQKDNVEVFTEAESTDNDFLRALGETGLLGFLTFYAIVAVVCFYAFKGFTKINDIFYATIVAALASAIIGLLANAVLIDVFEASKVAYMFWIMSAILLATVKLATKQTKA
jgi:hypothetical protein